MASVISGYGWALWLAAPVVATVAASVRVWWRARPRHTKPDRAAQEHQRYLDALGRATANRAAAGGHERPSAATTPPERSGAPAKSRSDFAR